MSEEMCRNTITPAGGDSFRCRLAKGHAGRHVDGLAEWDNTTTTACTETVSEKDDVKVVTRYLLEKCTGRHDCPVPHAAMDRIVAEVRALRHQLAAHQPLLQSLVEERALVQPYARATTARKIRALNREMRDARAVTNAALRRVRTAVRELRDLCLHLLDVSTENTPETSERYDVLSTTIDELFPPDQDAP